MLRGLLRIAETPYAAAVAWRNRRFDTGDREVIRVGVPVVSVGNLTLGGTGKTPMVAFLAQWFCERGMRPAIVSRGYGAASATEPNDEALELAARLPGVPHVQNRDRVLAAQTAIDRHAAQVIIMDDGFQHRRLARDLDIVLLDATVPFGYDHVFPRGMLREPARGLARAHVVILTRSDLVDHHAREAICQRARNLAPTAVWVEAVYKPQQLFGTDGRTAAIESLAHRAVAAFCAIGNPGAFRRSLLECHYEIAAFREFPDHHRYTRAASGDGSSDEASLATWSAETHAEAVVTTHKDLVKLPIDTLGGKPLWAIGIGTRIHSGDVQLTERLKAIETQVHGAT